MSKKVIINSNGTLDSSDQPKPPKLGESMVNITSLIGTKPDFTHLTKPTQQENGLRQFKDEKGVYYEMDRIK